MTSKRSSKKIIRRKSLKKSSKKGGARKKRSSKKNSKRSSLQKRQSGGFLGFGKLKRKLKEKFSSNKVPITPFIQHEKPEKSTTIIENFPIYKPSTNKEAVRYDFIRNGRYDFGNKKFAFLTDDNAKFYTFDYFTIHKLSEKNKKRFVLHLGCAGCNTIDKVEVHYNYVNWMREDAPDVYNKELKDDELFKEAEEAADHISFNYN